MECCFIIFCVYIHSQGYCYENQCSTLDKQCKYLWGSGNGSSQLFFSFCGHVCDCVDASVAHDVCYDTGNRRGDECGHCGVVSFNIYKACSTRSDAIGCYGSYSL